MTGSGKLEGCTLGAAEEEGLGLGAALGSDDDDEGGAVSGKEEGEPDGADGSAVTVGCPLEGAALGARVPSSSSMGMMGVITGDGAGVSLAGTLDGGTVVVPLEGEGVGEDVAGPSLVGGASSPGSPPLEGEGAAVGFGALLGAAVDGARVEEAVGASLGVVSSPVVGDGSKVAALEGDGVGASVLCAGPSSSPVGRAGAGRALGVGEGAALLDDGAKVGGVVSSTGSPPGVTGMVALGGAVLVLG